MATLLRAAIGRPHPILLEACDHVDSLASVALPFVRRIVGSLLDTTNKTQYRKDAHRTTAVGGCERLFYFS